MKLLNFTKRLHLGYRFPAIIFPLILGTLACQEPQFSYTYRIIFSGDGEIVDYRQNLLLSMKEVPGEHDDVLELFRARLNPFLSGSVTRKIDTEINGGRRIYRYVEKLIRPIKISFQDPSFLSSTMKNVGLYAVRKDEKTWNVVLVVTKKTKEWIAASPKNTVKIEIGLQKGKIKAPPAFVVLDTGSGAFLKLRKTDILLINRYEIFEVYPE